MSKEIIYKLPYEKDGDILEFEFKINFVPNGFIKKYNEIMSESYKVKVAWDALSDINTEISALMTECPLDFEEKIFDLESKKEELQESILNVVDLDIEKKRFEIISILLHKNGYNQDFLHDFNFWEWSVEPGVILDFMSTVAFKDIEPKKKTVR